MEIIKWEPDRIEIKADFPSQQFLVLSEIFYEEGWKITSHPEWQIKPVNTVLRGLEVPKGKHNIVMEFIPQDIRYGSLITLGSFLLLLLMAAKGWIYRKK